MVNDPFRPFRAWLAWLHSPEGVLHRQAKGQDVLDSDLAALLPTPPGQAIFTVGDLAALVQAGDELERLRRVE